jgi:hypothetical protein
MEEVENHFVYSKRKYLPLLSVERREEGCPSQYQGGICAIYDL